MHLSAWSHVHVLTLCLNAFWHHHIQGAHLRCVPGPLGFPLFCAPSTLPVCAGCFQFDLTVYVHDRDLFFGGFWNILWVSCHRAAVIISQWKILNIRASQIFFFLHFIRLQSVDMWGFSHVYVVSGLRSPSPPFFTLWWSPGDWSHVRLSPWVVTVSVHRGKRRADHYCPAISCQNRKVSVTRRRGLDHHPFSVCARHGCHFLFFFFF